MKLWPVFNKIVLISGLISGLFGLAVLPKLVAAQSVDGQSISIDGNAEEYITDVGYKLEQPFGGKLSVANLGEYIQTVYQFSLGLVGIIAVVLIMFGGLRWVSAAGNEQKITEAKEVITSAVTGLIIALLSYTILLLINPQLVRLDFAVFKIPIPTKTGTMFVCAADSTLIEASGAKYCKGLGTSTVTSTDLNEWITQYNSGGVSLTFLKAIIKTESAFCIDAMSNIKNKDTGVVSHACGLMQVLPTTAKQYAGTCGVSECASVTSDSDSDTQTTACCTALRTNPEKAVCVGVNFMASLKSNTYTNGDETLMAAAYNGGTCNSKKTNGALCPSKSCTGQLMYECAANSGYAETRNYVGKVSANKEAICKGNGTQGAFSLGCTPKNNNAMEYYCYKHFSTGLLTEDALFTYAACEGASGSCSYLGEDWNIIGRCDTKTGYVFDPSTQSTTSKYAYTAAPTCMPL